MGHYPKLYKSKVPFVFYEFKTFSVGSRSTLFDGWNGSKSFGRGKGKLFEVVWRTGHQGNKSIQSGIW
jgi:hypothetical protein